ncbi:hypothetical protein PMIN07_007403 [Paraphaeosphaeria minitans]
MAFRTGPYFDSSRFVKRAGIQHRPAKLRLLDNNDMPKPTFIKNDRRYRPVDEVPKWVKSPTGLNLIAGTKRHHDTIDGGQEKIDGDYENDETHPRKKHLKEEEWAILKYSKPLLCCIEFLVSWTPARLEQRRKEWERKILTEEMEHLRDLQEQLKKHPDYIIVNGCRLHPADAGYVIGSPTTSSSSSVSSEGPTTPSHTTEQGTRTSPKKSLKRPLPSDDGDDDTNRPPKPSGGAGISYTQTITSYMRTPTPTQLGVHKIDLPGGLTHLTGPPIHMQPVDMEGYKARLPLRDDLGRLVDKKGRLVKEQGLLINAKGQLVDKKRRRIPKLSGDKLPGEPITLVRKPLGQPLPPTKPLKKPQLVDEYGRFMDEQGRLVDEKGRLVNSKGQLIDKRGYLVDESRRSPAHLLGEKNPSPTKRPRTPKVRPPRPQATKPQAPSVEEGLEGSYKPRVSPKKTHTTNYQAPSFEWVPDRPPTPSDKFPPPQTPEYEVPVVEEPQRCATSVFEDEKQSVAYNPHSPPQQSQSPQLQPQSPLQHQAQSPPQNQPQSSMYQPQSPQREPQSPTPIAIKPPTPRPPFPEDVVAGEPRSEDDIPATWLQQQSHAQLEPPAVEPNFEQANTNPFSEMVKNMSAVWPAIANPFSQTANTATAPTVDPTSFLDNIIVPPEALLKTQRPDRVPFVDEDEQQEKKDNKNKKNKSKPKPVDKRTPNEMFLAKEEDYAPLPPRTRIIGTPRGCYGLKLAPDMVRGEDLPLPDLNRILGPLTLADRTEYSQPQKCRVNNPSCQKLGAKYNTFKTGRELREHEATHDSCMFGAFGPAGSMGDDMQPVPISPEKKERLLRERELERRPFPVDRTQLALEQSGQEARQRAEREKKTKERAERLLTEGDLLEEMSHEEFDAQFIDDDVAAPALEGVDTDEEGMTGEKYQQQLLNETLGDEAPDPNLQQTYAENVVNEEPMTAEDYQRLLDEYVLNQAQRNSGFFQ